MPNPSVPTITQTRDQVQADLNKIEATPTFTGIGNGLNIDNSDILDVNLKTVNGNSLKGTGNVAIATYQPFPSSWSSATSGTIASFCAVVNADSSAVKGMAYLGELRCSDLPSPSLVNVESVVEIVDGTGTSGKTIHVTVTSGDIAPYRWEYTYWNNGGRTSGWVAFQQNLTAGDGISITNNVISVSYPLANGQEF